jgi:CRISPR-associated endonuclease/helicase Cas3
MDRLSNLFGNELGGAIAACAYTSIARHHGPRSRNLKPFKFIGKAQEAVTGSLSSEWRDLKLDACGLEIAASQFSDELLTFVRSADKEAWPLYVFLVRRLRLADQASLRSGE